MIRRDRRVPTARRVYDFYWDGDDRLRKVTYTGALPDPPETWPNPAATERFRATYDAGGIRASAWDFWKGQHNYTWSAFGIVHDTNTNRTFTPGLAQRRGDPAEDKFIHADHIGSTRWLSKMDGTFPNGLRYTAYGQKAWQTGGDWQPVDFLFAGESGYITEYSDEQNPGVALLYLQQRYYDPDIGRFLTPDPIGFAGGLNLYAYCGNDPVNNVDPSGLCQQCATGKAGGLDLSCNDYWPPTGGNKVPATCGGGKTTGGKPTRAGTGAGQTAAGSSAQGPGFLARAGARVAAAGRAVIGFFRGRPAVRVTSTMGHVLGEARVPVRFTDAVSATRLRGKSLTSGEKMLCKLSLAKRANTRGGFDFVDEKGVVRARWDRSDPNHWHKFVVDEAGQLHRLNDAGHAIDDSSATSVHIPSR